MKKLTEYYFFICQWHPVRPIISSISSGVVSIWAQNQVENWSAFAPDFKELDENVEYEERESEFDLSDEDKSVVQGEEAQDEEIEVDVAAIDRVAAFCSSDEETEDIGSLQFLPISPDVEENEESQTVAYEPPPKKHRSHDIHLPNAPVDGEAIFLLIQYLLYLTSLIFDNDFCLLTLSCLIHLFIYSFVIDYRNSSIAEQG